MMELQGRLIARASMRVEGKPDRKVLQILMPGPQLFTLVNVSDMSKGIQPGLKIGQDVSLPVSVGAYTSRSGGAQVSYTFWGFETHEGNGHGDVALPIGNPLPGKVENEPKGILGGGK